jgi:hypothetical protein
MVADVTSPLWFLEQGPPGQLGVVVLEGLEGRWAPVFSDRLVAERLCAAAPPGVRVGTAPAHDPRAREELLLACLQAGAEVTALDPAPGERRPHATSPVRPALAYVRSLRTGSACL